MSDIEETIKDRHEKYGSFKAFSKKCNRLKYAAYIDDDNDEICKKFGVIHSEALNMIFVKIARILVGDPNLVDNWHDIAGYARLVEIELQKEETSVK